MSRSSEHTANKNHRHEQLMEARLSQFLQIIKDDEAAEIRKIEEKTHIESQQSKTKIIAQGVEKEEEISRKKNLNVNIEAKIRKSSKINEARMLKMQTRYELIQKMKGQLMNKLKEVVNDPNKYKELLVKLIVQGMLKLMDTEVEVKCLKKDIDIVKQVLGQAQRIFNKLSEQSTTTKIRCKLNLNTKQTIQDQHKNSLGGVILNSYNGRIVCINTLDARFKYCVEDMLPQLRQGLFGKDSK